MSRKNVAQQDNGLQPQQTQSQNDISDPLNLIPTDDADPAEEEALEEAIDSAVAGDDDNDDDVLE